MLVIFLANMTKYMMTHVECGVL